MNPELASAAAAAFAPFRFTTAAERLNRYEIPERGAPGHSSGLLLPETQAEVGALLAVATSYRVPLVISGGRTGLVEAQRPEGEVVLSLEKLNKIINIDAENLRATVEAGVAVDTLNAELEPLGLVWPMEMGSTSSCTVGGCVSNGSAGANAVCYGTAAHLCESAQGFWANGEATGDCLGPQWVVPSPQTLAIDSADANPALGLIGSQGVLGVATQLCLRLHRLPALREAALLPVVDMPAAMVILQAAQQQFPDAVEEFEFISARAIALVQTLKGAAFRWPFDTPPDSPWYVLLQVKTHDAHTDLAGDLYRFLAEGLQLDESQIGYAPIKALKEIRHSITEASNHRMRALGGGRLSFDTATPVAQFGAYLSALDAALKREYPAMEFIAFGHAGVGGAHLHVLGNQSMPIAACHDAIIRLVFDVTAEFGGTFSAEHGVGSKWGTEYLARAPQAKVQRLFAAKRLHDPAHILNPRCFGLNQLLAT